jgi:CRP/FNR family transcriptional regulator
LQYWSEKVPEKIRANSLLVGLPEKYAGKLLAGDRTITLSEGEVLFERGDAGDGCYWVHQGVLKVFIASATGEERILAILGPGAIVGELAMIDSLPRSATVQVVRNCKLTFVSRTAFTSMLQQHPEIYGTVLKTIAARLRQSDEDMVASSFLTVRARVARALLQFTQQLGEDVGTGHLLIRHKITQGDLAAMAGVARESVSRTMGVWRRQSIVTQSAAGYVVQRETLRREAAFEET